MSVTVQNEICFFMISLLVDGYASMLLYYAV